MISGSYTLEGTVGARAALLCREMPGRRTGDGHLVLPMSAVYFVIGFSPITALAISIMGFLPLNVSALLTVLPLTVLGIVLAFLFPQIGKLALKGFVIGLIAVFLYDCMRIPFIVMGVWGDFIPKIGQWLLNSPEPNWAVGYAWRYLGDGGGMGMAFVVAYCLLKPRVSCRRVATGYGVAIWLCLMLTLLLAPHGQQLMFKLTPTSVGLSLLGHVIYGASLGLFLAPPRRTVRHAGGTSRRTPRSGSTADVRGAVPGHV